MTDLVRRKAALAGLIMLAAAGASVLARPTHPIADVIGVPNLDTLIPEHFGDWHVDANTPVILPAPDVQALLDKIYNQTLARTYTNSQGQRIMLSVAYGGDQSDGTSAHRPEVCYPAQGFAISFNRVDQVQTSRGNLVPVRRLMSRMGNRSEPITYWVIVGSEVVTTGIEQKLAQMRYGVRGLIADGMLVRVSSIDEDMQRGHALQTKFITELSAAIPAQTAPRLFGGKAS